MSVHSRILTGQYIDELATLTASSAVATLPVTNLQREFRSKVWRATGCASEYVRAEFAEAQNFSALVLVNHNLSNYGEITVKAGTSAGDDSLLSETFDAWEPIWGYGQNWGIGWGGYLPPSMVPVRFPAGTLRVHYFAEAALARFWEIAFTDPDNTDGYIQVGRLLMDNYRVSERGVQVGMGNTPADPSTIQYGSVGQVVIDRKTKFRAASYSYPYVPGSETWALWYELLQEVGVGRSFVMDGLYGIEETNLAARQHNLLYCHIPEGGIREITVPIMDRGMIALDVRESVDGLI